MLLLSLLLLPRVWGIKSLGGEIVILGKEI
jgi:hypothetical protein